MSSLPAKFASAQVFGVLVFGVVATAASTALAQSASRAADNCLLEPGTDTLPQGKHWYYRIERGTGRKCWYTRDADDTSARAEAPSAAPADKPAPRRAEAAPTRSISDAHAEIAPRGTRAPVDAPAPAAVAPSIWQAARTTAAAAVPPAANAGPPPLAPRWPQAEAPAPAANPQPQASQSQASQSQTSQPQASPMVADAADSNPSTATDAAAQTLPPPDLAAAPVERNRGSLHQLVLVAVGALALAGLTGSAVYRLGRRRKRQDWLRERSNWQSLENPRDPPWVDPQFAVANSNVPDLDEVKVKKAEPALQLSPDFEADESGGRVEKIEDFLARLTKQLHDELEGMPPATERKARAAS
jgi:hypothetical protein